MTDQTMLEKCARAIADGLGDNFDHAFTSKSEWNAARGEKGGRYRDINEPMQDDYIEAARAVIDTLMEPTPEMVDTGIDILTERGCNPMSGDTETVWQAMLTAAKGE